MNPCQRGSTSCWWRLATKLPWSPEPRLPSTSPSSSHTQHPWPPWSCWTPVRPTPLTRAPTATGSCRSRWTRRLSRGLLGRRGPRHAVRHGRLRQHQPVAPTHAHLPRPRHGHVGARPKGSGRGRRCGGGAVGGARDRARRRAQESSGGGYDETSGGGIVMSGCGAARLHNNLKLSFRILLVTSS